MRVRRLVPNNRNENKARNRKGDVIIEKEKKVKDDENIK